MRLRNVAALAVTTVATAALLTATPGATDAATTAACGTWQYRITKDDNVYEYPGGPFKAVVYKGEWLNADITGDSWYRGRFYSVDKSELVTRGWIAHHNLDYITCW
ncbi:hypothetical protein [Actinophytocola gossypii]|uniref:SH3 domain-containing protein n=1 Tax=Actinophytocola gossypii TaxID=2812003 RepID=A0ABT2J9M5_9PSEU|nr:hypothetical protein [Actinophytocola gossypii]MCT2584567.1 hypothetical protein [Actinophytocola gossypii]